MVHVETSVPEVCLDDPGAAYIGVNDRLDAMMGNFEETESKVEKAFSLTACVGTEVPKQERTCPNPRTKASNGRAAQLLGIYPTVSTYAR